MPRGRFGRQSAGDRTLAGPSGGATVGRLQHFRRKACHHDPAQRVCSGCHRDIRSNRRVGFLLRPHLQNRRHCSGRPFIRLDRRFVHVRAGSRFSLLTAAANAFSRQQWLGINRATPSRYGTINPIDMSKWRARKRPPQQTSFTIVRSRGNAIGSGLQGN
jgi:hypothetical protein